MPGLLIAIVGAESTGKSSLAQALQTALGTATGLRCMLAPELLREWCDAAGRTPRPEEQAAIATAQSARCMALALEADLVICDTTPLMTAVYSELLFADPSLLATGLAFHQRCALTLLTALDLPWVADGLQRDGPHVRAPVDAAVRRALLGAGLGWSVVAGRGEQRLEAALNAVTPLLARRANTMPGNGLFSRLQTRQEALPEWRWVCDNCDVPECEHLSLQKLRS